MMLFKDARDDREYQSKQNLHFLSGFLILFSLFLLFFNLGGRSLEIQDNFQFAEIGREILETGDWVMMHKLGMIYVHKPPLHTWNIALSYRIFGLNPMAARFPSALFGLMGVLALLYFGVGVEKENPRLGIYAAFFLIASYDYFIYSRTCRNDIPYSVLFSLSLISFYMGYETKSRGFRLIGYLLFWVFLGGAFLVKGPVAFLAIVIVAVYLLFRRGSGSAGYKILLVSSSALFVVILSWLIPLLLHPDFGQYFELLKTTKILTRRAGLLYYFPEFVKMFFPGSVVILISIPALWKSRRVLKENPRMLFCLIWAGIYLLALHFTQGKNHRYLIPSFFPLSVIAAWGIHSGMKAFLIRQGQFRHMKTLAAVMAALICLVIPVGVWVLGGGSWGLIFFALASLVLFILTLRVTKSTVILVCVFYALGLLSSDLFRTATSYEYSEQLRLYDFLKKEKVPAEGVLIYLADMDGLDFYYNKVLNRSGVILDFRDGVKAVVTRAAGLDVIRRVYGAPVKIEEIRDHKGSPQKSFFVVFVDSGSSTSFPPAEKGSI